jgi:hypothetical protein
MNYPLFRSNTTGATIGGGTPHTSEVIRRVLILEAELLTLQKKHDGATSGGGTIHSSEITRWVLQVKEELPTLQK